MPRERREAYEEQDAIRKRYDERLLIGILFVLIVVLMIWRG